MSYMDLVVAIMSKDWKEAARIGEIYKGCDLYKKGSEGSPSYYIQVILMKFEEAWLEAQDKINVPLELTPFCRTLPAFMWYEGLSPLDMWVSYFTWACHQGLGFKDPSCPCCKNLTKMEWIKKQIKKRVRLKSKCACGDLLTHESLCLLFGEDNAVMNASFWEKD